MAEALGRDGGDEGANAIRPRIGACHFHRHRIYIGGEDVHAGEFRNRDGEDAGAGADVQRIERAAGRHEFGNIFEAARRRFVMAGAEGLPGIDE